MKKLFCFSCISMLVLLMSCTDSTESSSDATVTSQDEKNLASSRKVYKAIETGDAATLDSLIADDAIDHQSATGIDIKGKDSVKHMLADIHNHLKDAKFDVIADAANGDYIFSLVQTTGTTTDTIWGMPAGTKIDEKGVDVVRIRDGKMVEHWNFVDPRAMMEQLK